MQRILVTSISVFAACHAFSQPALHHYLQLNDRLDRQSDGYCLDVVGSGTYIRLDMPLTAHNCKGPQVYFDEVVQYRVDKTLYFPAYDRCVTVMGINDKALIGNALMLKECGIDEPFLNAKRFQQFEFKENGQLKLMDSNLCISVGVESHTTYSLKHKWRSLFMDRCAETDIKRSAWKFVPAGYEK